MIYKNIPPFQEPIPSIVFGGAAISGEGGGYGFGDISEAQSEMLLKCAWDHGITFFDTAPIYGFGLSEVRMGKYLPQDAFIITKSGVDWHENKRVNMSNSRDVTERMLHESLKRLRRESIDLYMIHWPDSKVDIREPLEVLKKFQDEGKIKHLGLCNTNPDDLLKARDICHIVALQSELNLFNQKPFLDLGDAWKNKFSMSWGTFDKGILSGRVVKERKFDKSDARSWAPWWNKKEVIEKIDKTSELWKILQEYEISLEEFCLQFNLHYFGLSSCLIGLKSVRDIVHVTSNLQSKLMRERIEEVLVRWEKTIGKNTYSQE